MEPIQIVALAEMAVFYIAYFTKMFLQRRKGVQTDQIGKGDKSQKVLMTEILMKIATYAIVPVELVSILWDFRLWDSPLLWIGIGAAALGVFVFLVAMCTMRDSWRAGIPGKDKTELSYFCTFCDGHAALANFAGGAVLDGYFWRAVPGI